MAVSDQDVMAQMGGGGLPSSPAAPGAIPPATPSSPAGAPMAAPSPKLGNREGSLVNISMALDLLEQSLAGIGSETPEGAKVMGAMKSLHALLGPRKPSANELQPAEIQQLIGALPQGMGGSPEMKAMMGGAPSPTPAPAPGAPAPMAA